MTNSEQMLSALEDNDLKQADELFQKALKEDDPETLYSLAEELYAMGFLEQASTIYQQLLAQFPDEDQIRTTLADIAVSNGQYDDALNLLTDITPESNAYAESLLTAADVYQTMGLPEVSEQKLLTALRLYPDEPVMQFALAELYFEMGEYGKAANYYEALIDQDVMELGQVNIQKRLATSYASSGVFEEALQIYETMTVEFLTEDDQFQMGFLYLQIKDYQKAIEILTKLQLADPQYTSLYVYLATAQEAQNELQEALTTVQTGIGYDMYSEVLYQKGSDLALQLGDDQVAEQMLNKALEINPDNMGEISALSQVYRRQNRHAENVAFVQEAIANHKPTAELYWSLAQSQFAIEAFDDARENYLLAYPELKDNPEFLHDLILFFQEMAQVPELLAALKQYLKLVPNDLDMQTLYDDYQTMQ
ncbi:tetratricopeptide repeat protein [Latilactobacillus sakei]|uniref:tetratricopeptide repeat protein n=1 Tax=Latilactobacillus sakei TaxID=1599 RepID=UPI000DC6486A|nr:tetratricopeptide repeat protein [Latilactobacillus sakei]SPS03781.1 tetratricopeptide repeat protein [Latilactobacillus sakei]